MSNRQCPKCGEEYSSTYRSCPFCEEEAAIRSGRPIHRRGGKRVDTRQRSSNGGAGGVLLVLTGVIILCVVAYVLLGDRVADTLGIRDTTLGVGQEEENPANSILDAANPSSGEDSTDSGSISAGSSGPLALSQANIEIAAGDTARLTSSGGTGEVVWSTSNENIVTVDNGAITGVAGGTATITVTSGEESVSCEVKVTGDPYVSNVKLKLNKTDFTLPAGDPDVQMRVIVKDTNKDYTGDVAWKSSNTGVVTISESGLVVRVGSGVTTITATAEGQTLECTVRVP